MTNPNNCRHCRHYTMQRNIENSPDPDVNDSDQKLHCYMFKDVPTDVCHQHTMRNSSIQGFTSSLVEILRAAGHNPEPF